MDIKINTGIPDAGRELSKRWLNHILADSYVVYTKTRKFHWMVTGLQFMELHKQFESIYETLDSQIDDLAERVRALDYNPLSTLSEFLEETEIKEYPGSSVSAQEMISELLADLEHLIKDLRKASNAASTDNIDMSTNNMLIGFMESHEKTCWFLRSYLK